MGGERREERRETRWRPSEVDDGGNGGGSSFSFSLAQLDAIFLPLSRPFLMLFVSNRPRRLCQNVRDSPTRVDWRIAGNGKGEGERRNEEIGKKQRCVALQPRRRRRQRGRDAAVGGASAAASSCTALSALLRSMHSHRHDCDPCRRSAIDRDREEPGSKRLGRSRLPRSGRKTHTREFQKRRGGRKKNSCFFKFTHPAPTARARRPRVAPAGRQREHPALSRGGDEGSRDDEERRVRGGAAIEWSRQKEELIESK